MVAALLVQNQKLVSVYRKVGQVLEVRDQYCRSKHNRASVEDLQYAVETIYNIKIEKLEVRFEGRFLRGLCERYADGRARILVNANQDNASLRFTTVKEMSHIIIDEPEDWSANGEATISHLLELQRLTGVHTGPAELNSEKLAEIAAIELMMPYDLRKGDVDLIAKGEQTIASLGLHYDVPDHIVEYALSDSFREFAGKYWQLAKQQTAPAQVNPVDK